LFLIINNNFILKKIEIKNLSNYKSYKYSFTQTYIIKMNYDDKNRIQFSNYNVNIDNNTIYNHYRSNDNGGNSFSDSTTIESEIVKNDCNNDEINVNIFRFKFTNDFTIELYNFSKIHQYDHRKDFKEAWNIWLEQNEDIVCEEVRRLSNLNYDGNILEKMFKSARYYFRKKSTEKKEPAKRRVYQSVQKDLLDAMDAHIKMHINEEDYKPSEGFGSFCKEYIDVIKEEVNQLCKNGFSDSNEIKNKIKKTYKNRYFLLISK